MNEDNGFTVTKRNGRTEPFDEDKLAQTVGRAGIPFVMAKDISKTIYKKIGEDNKSNKNIPSTEIKSLVIEELKSRNESTIAESYSGYSKNVQTSLREEFGNNQKYDSKVGSSINAPNANNRGKDKDYTGGRGSMISP